MADKIVILGYASSVHIVRWARGLASRGYNITVISCGGTEIPDIKTIIFGSKSGVMNYFRFRIGVHEEISKIQPEIVHAFQATGYALWGSSGYDCARVLTPLGSDIIITPGKSILHDYFVRHYLRKYDRFTTSSEYLKGSLMKLYPNASKKISVVPFGVDIPAGEKKHIDSKIIRLAFIKKLMKIYGPYILIEAMALLKESNLDIRLDIYGDGPEELELKQKVVDLKLDRAIKFMGWLNSNKIPQIYLDYDIMVMPSLSESFGVAAVEASSIGLPIVASDVGGISEVVKDGITGILVPPGKSEKLAESIMKLALDVELRRRMGLAGKKYVAENFEWDNCLDKMIAIYKDLIHEKRERY